MSFIFALIRKARVVVVRDDVGVSTAGFHDCCVVWAEGEGAVGGGDVEGGFEEIGAGWRWGGIGGVGVHCEIECNRWDFLAGDFGEAVLMSWSVHMDEWYKRCGYRYKRILWPTNNIDCWALTIFPLTRKWPPQNKGDTE
jgi:hypothetical protein